MKPKASMGSIEYWVMLTASSPALIGPLEGYDLVDRVSGDDHARGVSAGVPRQPFETARRIQQLLDALVRPVYLLELFALLDRLVQGDVKLEGHQPGDPVDLGVRHGQGAADIPYRCPGAKGAKGDDLRDVVAAVFLYDVVDDLLPPIILEVHVDVRHLVPLDVQEPLEDHSVLERIDVCDAQGE